MCVISCHLFIYNKVKILKYVQEKFASYRLIMWLIYEYKTRFNSQTKSYNFEGISKYLLSFNRKLFQFILSYINTKLTMFVYLLYADNLCLTHKDGTND